MTATRTPTRPVRRTGGPATATEAVPDRPVGAAVRTVPAYAAGCGNPDVVLKSASEAGFRCGLDENLTAWAVSPDEHLRLEFGPDSARYAGNPMGGLWLVTYTDPAEPRSGWRAQFGDNCPAEAVAAFIKALVIPGGLDPERADMGEADSEITVTMQASTRPVAATAEEQADRATGPVPAQATV